MSDFAIKKDIFLMSFFYIGLYAIAQLGLQPVNQDVQSQPHYVHEVPIPRCAFESKMLLGAEMAFLEAQGDEEQHQHPYEHMKAMETCEHVER
jgi:hypothetical protein